MADFNPDQYLKEKAPAASGGFDPDAYIKAKTPLTSAQQITANAQQLNDAGDASNDALFDTLTAGHLPQVKAKIKQLLNGEGMANDANYVKRRDQEIADMKAREEKFPAASMVGKTAGFVAPMLLTGGGSIGAEGLAGAAEGIPALTGAIGDAAPAIAKQGLMKAGISGARTGTVLGAAQNPGDTPGVVDPIQAGARLKNAGVGMALGGTLSAAASKIPDAADAMKGVAETKAFKAAGAMLKDFRKGYANDSIEDTGRFILDHDLVKPGDTYDTVAEKALKLKNDVGDALGAGYDTAAKILPKLGPEATTKVETAGFNPVRDKDAVLAAVKDDLGYAFKGKAAMQAVSDYLDELAEKHGDQVLNPKVTNQIKTSLDKTAISWERNPLAREPDAEAALKSMRGYLNDKVSGQVQAMGEAIGNPEAAKNLAALNNKYGMASKVERIAADKANREAANKAIGLTDTISGGAGATAGAIVAGPLGAGVGSALGVGGSKLARTYGPAVVASGANTAAKALAAIPSEAILKTTNPAIYKELIGAVGAGPSPIAAASALTAQNNPTKGPDKWANDGADKLIQHADSAKDKAAIEKLRGASNDPKVKQLLIQASDLKAGTPAMAAVLSKIKSKIASGD